MGSFVMVRLSPVGADAPRFLDRRQAPAVKAAIAKDPVKALVMPVLPRAPRGNARRIAMRRAQPRRHAWRHALRTLVTFDVYGSPTWDKEPLPPLDDIPRRQRAGTVEGPALPGGCIQPGPALPAPPIGGLSRDDILTPHMLGVRGTCRCGWALAHRVPLAPVRHSVEPCRRPSPADSLAPDPPMGLLPQDRALPRPKTRRARGQRLETCHPRAACRRWVRRCRDSARHARRSLPPSVCSTDTAARRWAPRLTRFFPAHPSASGSPGAVPRGDASTPRAPGGASGAASPQRSPCPHTAAATETRSVPHYGAGDRRRGRFPMPPHRAKGGASVLLKIAFLASRLLAILVPPNISTGRIIRGQISCCIGFLSCRGSLHARRT